MADKNQTVILTIDDEECVRQSIRSFLEDYNYKILEAEDGREGLEVFEKEKPDMVLVDLRMPELDGLDVLSTVRKQSPDTPIIVVSGTGVMRDAVEALRLGAWDYLLKPVEDLEVLLHAVENALERARLIKENRLYQEHLEKEVERRTETIREREAQLKRAQAIAKVGNWELNIPKSQLWASREALNIFGVAGSSSFMSPEEITPFIHENDRGRHTEALLGLIRDGNPFDIEFRIHRKNDNSLVWIHSRGEPLTNESGEPVKISGVIQDITERKHLEAQLLQSQKMEAIGTLAGGIAHDFNNILAAIMGNTELLQIGLPDTDPIKPKLDNIQSACQRAKDLVRQILVFSRKSEQERRPVAIQLIVKEALKLLKASFPSTIEIRQSIAPGSYTVLAEPTHIHQILMNLCTNSHHAMRSEGGVLKVSLSNTRSVEGDDLESPEADAPKHWIKLSVSDTGHGMDTGIVERIFDPYFTTKEKGVGTGLGLSVVHGIVKGCGGTITVESAPGKGSTFNIFLPGVEGEEELARVEPQQLPLGNNEHILFIDDEEMLVDLGRNILEGLGYQVTTAKHSQDALKIFGDNPAFFDLVVTDMTMPRMTGDLLAKAMLQIRPDIPIILCTGYNELMTKEIAHEIGVKDFLMKPINISILAETIAKALMK